MKPTAQQGAAHSTEVPCVKCGQQGEGHPVDVRVWSTVKGWCQPCYEAVRDRVTARDIMTAKKRRRGVPL